MCWRLVALLVCLASIVVGVCPYKAHAQSTVLGTPEFDLLGMSPQNVRAYLDLQNYLYPLKHSLLQWQYVDLNHDELPELVALVKGKEASTCAVWILNWQNSSGWVQVWEHKASSLCHSDVMEAYSDGRLRICESWSVGAWRNESCSLIEWNKSWVAHVLEDFTRVTNQAQLSQTEQYYHFGDRLAQRSYTRIPKSAQLPIVQRRTSYDVVLSHWSETNFQHAETVAWNESSAMETVFSVRDNAGDIRQTPQIGAHTTLSHGVIKVQSQWNSHGLWLGIWIRDLTPSPQPGSCEQADTQESNTLGTTDHLALWFDLNPSLHTTSTPAESWEEAYVKGYDENPIRHEMDPNVYAIAVQANGCVTRMHPDTANSWSGIPQFITSPIVGGFFVQAFVPTSFFKLSDLRAWNKHAQGIGFSAVYHDSLDSENALIFRDLATSEWRWGDPYSFGELILLPAQAESLPEFPLQWDKWLKAK